MTDLISRADSIADLEEYADAIGMAIKALSESNVHNLHSDDIIILPSTEYARVEVYRDLYEKYIDLKHKAEWIPCSERLPSDSGDYLVWLEDESEHYAVIPFDADAEDFGWWQDYYHPVSLGFLDSEFIKAENVTAWQSLPEPYREDGEL